MEGKFFEWQVLDGEPVTAGPVRVTPQVQTLTIRLPFAGFVWNRPVAVLVEEDGRIQRLPIPDVTRMMMVAVAVLSTAVALMMRSRK